MQLFYFHITEQKCFPLKISTQQQNILQSDPLKSEWETASKDCSLLCLLVIYKQVLASSFFFFFFPENMRKAVFMLFIQIEKLFLFFCLTLFLWLENRQTPLKDEMMKTEQLLRGSPPKTAISFFLFFFLNAHAFSVTN